MATNTQDAVRLPSSGVEFCSYVSPFGDAERLSSTKLEELPHYLQKIIKYSGAALKSGRPYNKVMIVLTGESGVGKSSTIKALFNDETCFTDIERRETFDVTEYGRELCVSVEQPPVIGMLSFVDLPGNFHSDVLTQTQNLAAINRFREQHQDLLPRSPLPAVEKFCSLTVREQVYPNAVLFTVRATDNRMVGPDSTLRKSLRALRENNLLDLQFNNLIVVVTHAMSLPIKIYKAKSEEITRNIRTAVFEVLQIVDAKVVFVENRPEDFEMKKRVGSDFYELPDNQLSHYNLLQAMVAQFDATNDLLGNLLCGWYFMDDKCLEKGNNKTFVLYKVDMNTIGEEEMSKSLHLLNTVTTPSCVSQEEIFPTFEFQNLGRGYCPRTETLRNVVIYSPTATEVINVYGKKYYFTDSVVVSFPELDHSYLLTQETKDKYERKRMNSYDLSDTGIKLDVHIESAGRWVKNSSSGHNNSEVTFVYEKRLIKVKLDDPVSLAKKDLINAIMQLPESYELGNCHLFNEFFSKWGSHFICEEWIGGSIEVETDVDGSRYDDKHGSQILENFQPYFKSHDTPQNDSHSTSISMNNEMISTFGGDNSGLNVLADVTSERFAKWMESIKSYPTELNHSFKLQPYYELVNGLQHDSLKAATYDYLVSDNDQKLKTRRPMFSPKRNASGLFIVDKTRLLTDNLNCFTPLAQVYTTQGSITIDTLKPGDEVFTANLSGNLVQDDLITTGFCTYLHYNPKKLAEFMVLNLENGRAITITGEHLIYTYGESVVHAIRAKNVKAGDLLLYFDNERSLKHVSVISKSTKWIKGVCSPLTNAGTLIVDGVFVSCYANVDSHFIAHCSMAPLRIWYGAQNVIRKYLKKSPAVKLQSLCNTIVTVQVSQHRGIHNYALVLMLFSGLFPFVLTKC